MEKTLHAAEWKLTVDLDGGRIKELSHSGTPILGTYNRIDGKIGNTHICAPNFAGEGMKEYGLPFHGPSRNLTWRADVEGESSLNIICQMPATEAYPAELYIAQSFELFKSSFLHGITVENAGGSSVPVNIGIHNYWATPAGWEGAKVNGEDVTEKIRKNGFSPLRNANTITLPGRQRMRLKVKGFQDMMFWSAGKEQTYDTAYACLEPVFVLGTDDRRQKEKMLKPGSQRVVSQEISLL